MVNPIAVLRSRYFNVFILSAAFVCLTCFLAFANIAATISRAELQARRDSLRTDLSSGLSRSDLISRAQGFRQVIHHALQEDPSSVLPISRQIPELLFGAGLDRQARDFVLEFAQPANWGDAVKYYFEAGRWVLENLLKLDELDQSRQVLHTYEAVLERVHLSQTPGEEKRLIEVSAKSAISQFPRLLTNAGMFEEAISTDKNLIKFFGRLGILGRWERQRFLIHIAESYVLLAQYQSAEDNLDRALELGKTREDNPAIDPENHLLATGARREYLNTLTLLFATGNREYAIRVLKELIGIFSVEQASENIYALIEGHSQLGSFLACADQPFSGQFERAHELIGRLPYGMELISGALDARRAIFSARAGDLPAAESLLERAKAKYDARPSNLERIEKLPSALRDKLQVGLYPDLETDDINERAVYFRLAMYSLRRNSPEEARRYLAQYFALSPYHDKPTIVQQQLFLARHLLAFGHRQNGVSLIQQALKSADATMDERSFATHMLAMTELQEGKPDEALLVLMTRYGSEDWGEGLFRRAKLRDSLSEVDDDRELWELGASQPDELGTLDVFDNQIALFLKIADKASAGDEIRNLAFMAAQLISFSRPAVGISLARIREQIRDPQERATIEALYRSDPHFSSNMFSMSSRMRRDDFDSSDWSDFDQEIPCSPRISNFLKKMRLTRGLQMRPSWKAKLDKRRASSDAVQRLLRARRYDNSAVKSEAFGIARAISANELQARLRDDDVVVVIAPTNFGTYVGAVGKRGRTTSLVSDYTSERIRDAVATITRSLRADEHGNTKPFAKEEASNLYKSLLGPVLRSVPKLARVFLVTGPAISSLPFSALPAECGGSNSWLSDCYELSVLPSVVLYEGDGRPARTQIALTDSKFIGFGAPELSPPGSCGVPLESHPEDDLADPLAVRKLCDLAEAGDILVRLSRALNAPPATAVHVGQGATEKEFKELARQGVVGSADYIAFATHGLTAADTRKLSGLAEPSLVFTPPGTPSSLDDGLLTTSEIIDLRLSAKLVYLISCSSGSPDRDDAEAFSGLALSFLAAGAKALIVSYYPVDLDATAQLFERVASHLSADHMTPRKALQQAMKDIRDDNGGAKSFAHPRFWAGFTIIALG